MKYKQLVDLITQGINIFQMTNAWCLMKILARLKINSKQTTHKIDLNKN